MTTEQAIDTMAKAYIGTAIARGMHEVDWEDYPLVGENDWEWIRDHADALAAAFDVPDLDFMAAYRHLQGRVTNDA